MTNILKLSFISILCIFLACPAYTQTISQVRDKSLEKTLKSIVGIKHYQNLEYRISVIQVVLPEDIIPNQEGHELYTRLYIVVSKDGEDPPSNVYTLPNLVAIGEIGFKKLDEYTAVLEFIEGPFNSRKAIIIKTDSRNMSAEIIKYKHLR